MTEIDSGSDRASLVASLPQASVSTTMRAHDDALLARSAPPRFSTDLAQGPNGEILVATEGEGVAVYDPPTKRWSRMFAPGELADDDIYAIDCDKQGRVWLGHGRHGVTVVCNGRHQNYDVIEGPNSLAGPPGERVYCIRTAPLTGDVWVATSGGLCRHVQAKDQWQLVNSDDLRLRTVCAIAFDGVGHLLLATQCDGLLRISEESNTFDVASVPVVCQGIEESLLNDVLVTRGGAICVATT